MAQDTCILFFSRSATAEAEHKAFGQGLTHRQNTRIAKGLIRHTRATIEASGIPFVHYDESLQTGADFGEKLVDATHSVFDQGYEHIIIVGNDCPSLSTSQLLLAKAQLEGGQQVLAPTPTGGFYLIGVSRHLFDPRQFLSCAWQTEHCYSTFVSASTSAYIVLEAANDISEIRSFLVSAREQIRALLLTIIGFSLAEYCSSAYRNIVYPPRCFSAAHPFRGPPLSVLFAV